MSHLDCGMARPNAANVLMSSRGEKLQRGGHFPMVILSKEQPLDNLSIDP
jgi:hypothetical protein